MPRLSYITPSLALMESASEYFDMLRSIPVALEGRQPITLWEICDVLLKRKQERFIGQRDPYTDKLYARPTTNDLQDYTDAIRKTFRKRDRIVWAMRYVKYWMAVELKAMVAASMRTAPHDFFTLHFGTGASVNQPSLDEIIKRLEWLPKDEEWWQFAGGRVSGFAAAKRLASAFQHLLDFAAAQHEGNPLQVYDFARKGPVEVQEDLTHFENEIMEKRRQFKNAIAEQGAPIIRFSDKSAWFDLKCAFSREEGSAMGHCGNAGAGPGDASQTVLSYRTRAPREAPGQWIPHLTFILHQGTILGEMKGRFNRKPEPQYHPYIVELLKQSFIKMVVGGGYAPPQNFCLYKCSGMPVALNGWTDLSLDLAKDLHEAKPEIYHQGGSCAFCANTMPDGQEFDRSEARSLPYCIKYRPLKVKDQQPSIGQKIDRIDGNGTAPEGRPV